MTTCPGCLGPIPPGKPTCGAGGCLRIYRFQEITAGRPDPMVDLPRHHGSIVCCVNGRCYLPAAKWHGTAGGYTNHYCRCQPCTAAWGEYHYNQEWQLRYARRLLGEGLTVRGTPRKNKYAPHPYRRPGERPRRPIREDM